MSRVLVGDKVANKEVNFLCTKLDDAKSWERNGGSQAITNCQGSQFGVAWTGKWHLVKAGRE